MTSTFKDPTTAVEGRDVELRAYEQTFTRAALGIAHFDMDSRFIRVNPRLCEMHGYTAEELLQMNAGDIQLRGHGESAADFARLCSGAVTRYSAERRFIKKNGENYPARVSVSMVRDDPGGAPYVTAPSPIGTAVRSACLDGGRRKCWASNLRPCWDKKALTTKPRNICG